MNINYKKYEGWTRENLIEEIEKDIYYRAQIRKQNYEKKKEQIKAKIDKTKKRCELCNVEVTGSHGMAAHVKTKRHLNNGVAPIRVRRRKFVELKNDDKVSQMLDAVVNAVPTDTEISSDTL